MQNPYKQNYQDNNIITEYVSKHQMIKYQKIAKLGDGMFSQVYECIQLDTSEHFAIKIVQKSFLLKHNLRNQFMKEVKLHSKMNHKNVVRLYKVFEDVKCMFLVMELCDNGTLNSIIEKRTKLSLLEAKYYLKNIVEGLQYIHSHNIIHRDLKPANLVISKHMELKIADFGLASQMRGTQRRKTFCGTPFFIAPEIVRRDKHGHGLEADYWSVGVILYNMIYGTCPFVSDNVDEVYKKIKEGDFSVDDSQNRDANFLIKRLLTQDIQKRASFEEIMESKFMEDHESLPEKLPEKTLLQDPTVSFLSKYSGHLNPEIQNNLLNNVYMKKTSTSSALSDNKENWEYGYVKKWINYAEKFGIGFILNNGVIGILFNDKSKIVLSNFGITFHYMQQQSKGYNTYNILNYPESLEKKVKILEHLIKHLKNNKDMVHINENTPDNFQFLKNYKLTKYAVLLILSTGVYQMIFKDGTEIHIVPKEEHRLVIFIDKKRTRYRFEGEVTDKVVLGRLEYIQQELKELKSTKVN